MTVPLSAALFLATLLTLLGISPAARAEPDRYAAFYTVVEKDVRSAEHRRNMLRFYQMQGQITPAQKKYLMTVFPDQVYDAQVARQGGNLLYRLQARINGADLPTRMVRAGSEYVLVYDRNKDTTTSVERLPNSIGDIWIDKGLDSRKVPFLLLTSHNSPFLAPGERGAGVRIPLQAGPRYGQAGERAKILYQPARRQQQGKRVLLTASDASGKQEEWVFEYDDAALVGKTLPHTIQHTSFRGVPTPASGYKEAVWMPHSVWIARLSRVHTRTVAAELFEPSHWFKDGDTVTDNRSAPRQLRRIEHRAPLLAAGTLAPDFLVEDKTGKPLKLSDFRGKVVVLDFWATWCGPCLQSLPHTNAVAARFKDQGVVVLAVNVMDSIKAFQAWLANNPHYDALVFAVDPSPSGKDVASTRYQVSGIPTQYVIGKDGKVVTGFVGYEGPTPDLENAIKAAVKRAQ